jgi:hypothetical protein
LREKGQGAVARKSKAEDQQVDMENQIQQDENRTDFRVCLTATSLQQNLRGVSYLAQREKTSKRENDSQCWMKRLQDSYFPPFLFSCFPVFCWLGHKTNNVDDSQR